MPANPSLIGRNDTIFGICEAVGQDFGFHPNYLRVLFAGSLYFSPLGVIAAYFALGAVVLVSRFIAPDSAEAQPAAKAAISADNEARELSLAA